MASAAVAPLLPGISGFSLPLPLCLSHGPSLQAAFSLRPRIRRHRQQMRRLLCVQNTRIYFSARALVKYVDGDEAKKLVTEEGYSVLDVRDRTQYEKAHVVPSVHIPVFIENTDNDLGTMFTRTMHNNFSGLFFGLAFTKPNPEFLSSVEKKFSKESKLLLVCQEGLRSGAAADNLEGAGFQNLAYISSGLQKIKPGLFEKEGPRELQDAGKGGLVTVQGKISVVLGTVLIAAFLFITFFPNQAELFFPSQ